MKSLFRGMEMRRRESSVREALQTELITCVKGVMFEGLREGVTKEAEDSLCTVLEAIFLHGLKEKFTDKVSSLLGDPDQRPSPEFWNPVMIFCHSGIIQQINQLNQISTDVGRSRAWLRISLNEGLLPCYLSMISGANSALTPYYKNYAFLRDQECLSVSIKMIDVQLSFNLPVNSSMLNVWPNPPLLLAGLWTPPMKEAPVSVGTDIVKGIVEVATEDESMSTSSVQSSRLFEEEEALKIILGTPIEGSPLQTHMVRAEERKQENLAYPQTQDDFSSEPVIEGSNDEQKSEIKTGEEVQSSEVVAKEESIPACTFESYDKIIGEVDVGESEIKKDNLQDIIDKFSLPKEKSKSPEKSSPKSPTMNKSLVLEEYEIIEESSLAQGVPEFKFLIEHLGKLMHEKGLLDQNCACKSCGTPLGIAFSFSKPWVCSLTGCYYCKECFKPVLCPLPAKILHNWDFTPYPVCEKAANFLKDVQEFPLFDIRKINSRLYVFFPEMLILQNLRLQMNFIRSYLFTCNNQVKERVKQIVWPREYLYEHVHLYAIADLLEIPTGKLEDVLKNVIKLSVEHILSCVLCSQKGYICEVCNDKKVIYPFEIETTYRCPTCRSVYHLNCRQEICPKCFRIKNRKAKFVSV